MVDITPPVASGRQIIQGYEKNAFRIAGIDYSGPVFVTETETRPWEISTVEELCLPDGMTAGTDIRVLLVGTGDAIRPVPVEFRQTLRKQGIGVEIMDTGAACRTFNVLLSEERAVAALLIPLGDSGR